MRILFFLCLSFLARADSAQWVALGRKLVQAENYHHPDGYFLITNVVPPDRTKTHQFDFLLTTMLDQKPDGTIVPLYVRAGSEAWVLGADGIWDVDEWVRTANEEGTLADIFHAHLREDQDGRVLQYDYIKPEAVTDPQEIAAWEAVRERWYRTL
jgi:hypothetical protein